VLQHGDVSQHDWHPGQVLCTVNPQTQHASAILIDFALSSTTTDAAVKHWVDDLARCLAVLADTRTGIQLEIITEIFNRREPWDVDGTRVMVFPGGHIVRFERLEPFEFVYADEPAQPVR
jgi:hypothetical protein